MAKSVVREQGGSLIDTIVERVRAASRDDLREMLAEMLGAEVTNATRQLEDPAENDHASTYARTVNRIQRRTRRQQNPSKVYARNYTGRKMDLNLFPTANKVWSAIVSADKKGEQLSNMELEKATGLSTKTVQSCVWYLRNHDENGNRVKPGKRALVVSENFTAVE